MQNSVTRAALLIACLCLGSFAGLLSSKTPLALPSTAPQGVFSAGRAMIDDRLIAQTPHPQGSAAAQLARSYIFDRMTALGLQPRRLLGEAVESYPQYKGLYAAGGQVENLIGVLPGTDPKAKAVLLMAHSDSVPGSPGAADDAAGVVSILETVRALEALGPRRRAVVILITDGEEVGLLGARAFFQSGDPILKSIDMVLNFEARGGGGRVAMFETGARNGAAMGFFARHVHDTDSLSLMSEIYKYMPNSTDFTVAKKAGFAGYNFAFVGRQFDYHSPSSTPAALDMGSLQHMGDQALALTSALAAAPASPKAAPDAVFSDVFGGPVLSYSAGVQWALLGAAGVLAALGGLFGARADAERLRASEILRGVAAALCPLLAAVLALRLASHLLDGDLIRFRSVMAQFASLFAGMAAIAVGVGVAVWAVIIRGRTRLALAMFVGAAAVADLALAGVDPFGLVVAVLTLILSLSFRRPLAFWSGWLGAFLAVWMTTIGLQIIAPPLTVAIAWPLFLSAALLAACGAAQNSRFKRILPLAALGLAGIVCVADLARLAVMIFTGVGLDAPEAIAFLVFAGAPALYPLLQGFGEIRWSWVAPGALALLGAGLIVRVANHEPWSTAMPRPVQAFYLEDAKTRAAWRVDALPNLDPWSKRVLAQNDRPIVRGPLEPYFNAVYRAPTPFVPFTRPGISSSVGADAAATRVEVTARAGGRELRLYLQPTVDLQDIRVNGAPSQLRPRPGAWAKLVWAAPQGPVVLTFKAKQPGTLDLRYGEVIDGWPPTVAVLPKGPLQAPWGSSDTTLLTDGAQIRW